MDFMKRYEPGLCIKYFMKKVLTQAMHGCRPHEKTMNPGYAG